MAKYIVTLDLDSTKEPDYGLLDSLMEEEDFFKFSENKFLDLPENTYYANLDKDISCKELMENLVEIFKKNEIPYTRFFGGKLEDWTVLQKN